MGTIFEFDAMKVSKHDLTPDRFKDDMGNSGDK